jgi:hypothetical protein
MKVSDPIAVAAATATTFDLVRPRALACISVVFYTTELAEAGDEVAIGSGTRDIAVSKWVSTEDAGAVLMPIVGASALAVPAWNLKPLELGTPTGRISVACAEATTPGTATHYRIFVD